MAGLFGLGAARANPNQEFEKLKKAAADARLPFDRDAWLNISFYLDEQYVEWATEAMTIRRIPRKEGFENTPRPVQNKIMHFTLQQHAAILQSKPTPDVLPTSDDPLDISEANVSLAYLRWMADPQQADLDSELSDACLWALVAGEGFLKWTHNKHEGRGDVTSVSPLDLYIDPYARKFKNARYLIHSQFMDVEQVFDVYGKEIQPSGVDRADMLKTQLMREMGTSPVVNGAVVNELWMKPNRKFPKGLFTTWAGTESLVPPGDFPYKHGHLPFTQIGSIPRPGSSHYTSAVKYLRNPQMELNKYHAQRISVRETFANPKWYIDAALELEVDPDDSPNQILRGNGGPAGLEPKIIQGTVFPPGDEGSFILQEMMDTVGLHEVSQGQVPGRVESSKAIELLKESESTRQAEMLRTIKNSITEGSWQLLELARQYVDKETLVTVYSRDGLPEVKKFLGSHAKAGQRVRVTMGTGLARSRAAREEQVYKMVDLGLISDPEVAAELLDLPVGTISPDKAHDIRLARNENYTMADGKAITPNSWDDHVIHLREHNNYRKTTEFLMLSSDIKTKFEFHCESHDTLFMEFLKKEGLKIQLQAVASGQAQPAGAAPPPAQGGGPPGP